MNKHFGFVRVGVAVPKVQVADCDFNASQIEQQITQAVQAQAQVVCFPELSVTGYTCADLFFTQQLQQNTVAALQRICAFSQGKPIVVLIGAPLKVDNNLYNCAFVIHNGEMVGIVPKTNLPNTGEFSEKRWFWPGKTSIESVDLFGKEIPFGPNLLFCINDFCFGLEICEDLWSPLPASTQLTIQGAEIIFNLSSSNCLVGKHAFRQQMITQQSARVHCGYVYTSSGIGESTTDVVFSGSTYIAENGEMLEVGERFLEDSSLKFTEIDVERLRIDRQRNNNFTMDKTAPYRKIYISSLEAEKKPVEPLHRVFSQTPFLPSPEDRKNYCDDVVSIQTCGLAKRWRHTQAKSLLIGISGGLDSTLALLICVLTADRLGYSRSQIHGVTMPCFGTTNRTYQNALKLMQLLGITTHEIDIKEAVTEHFAMIEQDPQKYDATYENSQARYRTMTLMDMANKYNGLVVGTGDMSELALGWATYCGDQMSMYGVNAGIPKTLVRYMVDYLKDAVFTEKTTQQILEDICQTAISPELLPPDAQGNIAQKTEDKVGPYVLHDFFLYYYLRYGFTKEKINYMASLAFKNDFTNDEITHWLDVFMHRFFAQQYKRSCMPDGPKVVSVSLSPRGDWRMPSDVNNYEK